MRDAAPAPRPARTGTWPWIPRHAPRALVFALVLVSLGLAGCAVNVRPAPLHGHGYYGPRPYAYAPPPRRYQPPYRPYYGRPYGHYRGW